MTGTERVARASSQAAASVDPVDSASAGSGGRMSTDTPAARPSAATSASSSASEAEEADSGDPASAGPESPEPMSYGPVSAGHRAPASAGRSPGQAPGDRAAAPSSSSDGQVRPSLIERRKAATRMEIARAAAGLFMRKGLRATRAEDIARAAGIAPRTFYRYFASKEESLGPLFAAGAQKWAETVRDAPAHLSVAEALRHGVVQTMTPGVGVRPESLQWVRSLLRLAEGSPALLRVWGEACHTAERTLAEVLAARNPTAPEAVVHPADADADAPGARPSDVPPPLSPGLRLSAAVASAAVRLAVEAWAAGDDPADGPAGPVALAVRNLDTLHDFPWHTQ
ncbi:TetR/AcrR family transcriptional regulator [Streptomyces sp. NPDC050535]|uniref:TetR/AcrR family transcriptional regulator n=1 Tax=Streptomyces sp. NPDC050535 TaxID=3365626 RepID=UPI0037A21A59